jgi:uncharacterized protein YndB with AHSA1/START domain
MKTTTAALRKTARVNLAPAAAFELFTGGIGAWWPLRTHSVGLDDATSVECEPHVGGHIFETLRGGDRAIWGTFRIWEPPTRVRFTWHPGTQESEATDVEVTFHADGDGTLVELVHTGWERRPDGETARANYVGGWDLVFGRYAVAGSGGLVPD